MLDAEDLLALRRLRLLSHLFLQQPFKELSVYGEY